MVGRFTKNNNSNNKKSKQKNRQKKNLAHLDQKKCIKMYIETGVIAKKWKQPKCSSRALLLEKINPILYNEIQFKIESEYTTDKHVYTEEYKNYKAS